MELESKISSAAGTGRADILFKNVHVVNVFTGEILLLDVAVKDGHFCGFGGFEAERAVDLEKMYMVPGLIDAHVHIESAMVIPERFAEAVLPCGTTTCIADPHEIANVAGIDGIQYMIDSAENTLMNICFAMPSCVPATSMETAGACLGPAETGGMIQHPRIVALAEMMNYPGVIFQDHDVLEKVKLARAAGKPVDGHAPGLAGRDLYAYTAAGILSDHECTTAAEALEKLRLGMHIMIREGTCARNFDALRPVVNKDTWSRIMWCTDDRHPADILHQGHVDHIIRKAVSSGIDPVQAIRMGTLNPARYFHIHDAGAVAPGRRADFILTEDPAAFQIDQVWCGGVLAAENGRYCGGEKNGAFTHTPPQVMHVDVADFDFAIPARPGSIRVIGVVPDQVVTESLVALPTEAGGLVVADPARDIAKVVVVERYSGRAKTGKGFVKGLGLLEGAVASSVAHDSHNIIAAGATDRDMQAAVQKVVEMKGGMAVARDGAITASLPLPVAGLMSDRPLAAVYDRMDTVIAAAHALGSTLEDPFMALGFLALPVIPALKITDRGLVDVEAFQVVDLFVEKGAV